ncbi:hypothetical protein DRN86_03625 [Candidatus Geothermarchaeota archaeon]|nr:MAG: hypothetical protein DRN86_03625 [Candidatus Geothermarchaeota archaeon]
MLRRARERAENLIDSAKELEKRARECEQEALNTLERLRKEARRRLEPIIDKLDPKIREVLEKEPEKAWELGVLDASCVYMEKPDEYFSRAKSYRDNAERKSEEAAKLLEARRRIVRLLKDEKIAEALEESRKLDKMIRSEVEEDDI